MSGTIPLVAQVTAGIIVTVSFTETVDSIDKPNRFFDQEPSFITVAKKAQQAASLYGIEWPSQKLNTSLEDAVKALLTAIWDTQTSFAGYANQIAGDLEFMIEQVEVLTDPTSYPVYDLLVNTWVIVKNASAKASKDLGLRATASRIVQNDTTLSALAAEVGNTEDEIIQLNLAMLRSPIVFAGKTFTYYSGK